MPLLSTFAAASARVLWSNAGPLITDYLIAAGGGSGGATVSGSTGLGGNGGAGELIIGSDTFGAGAYPIVVGAGAAGRAMGNNQGGTGADSTAFGLTAKGGGGGGAAVINGSPGGSGGGAGGNEPAGPAYSRTGGASIASDGVGFAGGDSSGGAGGGDAGGGGGAGGAGAPGYVDGAGVASSISGVSVEYCKGGSPTTPGSGSAGAPSGGGATNDGADGIVIISYPGPQRATGGTISSSGGYTIHTFTTNGTFTVL